MPKLLIIVKLLGTFSLLT